MEALSGNRLFFSILIGLLADESIIIGYEMNNLKKQSNGVEDLWKSVQLSVIILMKQPNQRFAGNIGMQYTCFLCKPFGLNVE